MKAGHLALLVVVIATISLVKSDSAEDKTFINSPQDSKISNTANLRHKRSMAQTIRDDNIADLSDFACPPMC